MNDESGVERRFQIARHAFGIRVPARRRHGVADARGDVFTDARQFQRGQEIHDGLQLLQILFADFRTVLNGRDHFGNEGLQARDVVGGKLLVQPLVDAVQGIVIQ